MASGEIEQETRCGAGFVSVTITADVDAADVAQTLATTMGRVGLGIARMVVVA